MMLAMRQEEASRWLAERLAGPARNDLSGDLPAPIPLTAPRPAAVLIPLLWHPETPTVLLTRRADNLSQHPGQVSFPGGKVDPHDAGPVAAALREAHEEVGLDRAAVQVVGMLPLYNTITNFVVTPVVGLIAPPVQLTPAPGEVAEVFELPLELALDIGRYRREAFLRDGERHHRLVLDFDGQRVWGATAAMLYRLALQLGD
ncbi:CoA pyrophosphatase [Crenobacter sp. SG2305]|uniref:CoA pyrophosphatase n=1 Tax=Crenobacter oryzisoli TaxID=3056844 RepID=UPI0025AA7E56|nr:CoA pyrophosphatase [Crenobacter sp. SG2305]MDN0084001.1 CoA pyrophosphatase [Crenobacter sp. SG2305]